MDISNQDLLLIIGEQQVRIRLLEAKLQFFLEQDLENKEETQENTDE